MYPEVSPNQPSQPRRWRVPVVIAGAAALLILVMAGLSFRAASRQNQVALIAEPASVAVVAAKDTRYQATRRYVGRIAPWQEANLGPELDAAFVETVLVRPGAVVKRGQVLATLDCKSASAQSKALALQARSLSSQQQALAHEAARVSALLKDGYVSPNEAERKIAESASKQAELESSQARVLRASLEVSDCVLRAPFDGEVAEREMDPGGFARPGTAVVTVVDRSTVRMVADVPEGDYALVAPETPARVRLLALSREVTGSVSRRSPAADLATRTVRIEIDLPDPEREIPVGTTAELQVPAGAPLAAREIPLRAAAVRGDAATVFVVADGVAHRKTVKVLGESGGSLYCDGLPAGAQVVIEGRALLHDGDRVRAEQHPAAAPKAEGGR